MYSVADFSADHLAVFVRANLEIETRINLLVRLQSFWALWLMCAFSKLKSTGGTTYLMLLYLLNFTKISFLCTCVSELHRGWFWLLLREVERDNVCGLQLPITTTTSHHGYNFPSRSFIHKWSLTKPHALRFAHDWAKTGSRWFQIRPWIQLIYRKYGNWMWIQSYCMAFKVT